MNTDGAKTLQFMMLLPSACLQGNHAIAKMTARCAQYVSVGLGKRKISRRLRKNLHITIRR